MCCWTFIQADSKAHMARTEGDLQGSEKQWGLARRFRKPSTHGVDGQSGQYACCCAPMPISGQPLPRKLPLLCRWRNTLNNTQTTVMTKCSRICGHTAVGM